MNSPIQISFELIRSTLVQLQFVGCQHSECVLLWLAKRRSGFITIEKVWMPKQKAGFAFLEIPECSMEALFNELRTSRLFVAAQVHTHPRQAFHSAADDHWAILRHAGSLSLVLPYFALRTEPQTFFHHAAVFVLTPENEWLEVPTADRHNFYQIVQ